MTPLYISSETAEAVTSSWLSAVDMIAARIPHRNMPPMNTSTTLPSNICWMALMNTTSDLPEAMRSSLRKPLATRPKNEAAPSDRMTHTMAMMRDFLTSLSLLMAMKRMMM